MPELVLPPTERALGKWSRQNPIGSGAHSGRPPQSSTSAQSTSEKLSEQMPRPCHRWSSVTTRKRCESGSIEGNQVSSPVQPTACSSTTVGASGVGPGVSVT